MSVPLLVRREVLWRRTRRRAVIYTCSWVPVVLENRPPTVARLFFLTGYNSSVNSQHDWLASWLYSHGIESYSLDNHSFGRSTSDDEHRYPAEGFVDVLSRVASRTFCFHGLRGYIPSWNALCDDAAWFIKEIEAERGPLPTFIYGESMGGALALGTARYLVESGASPLDGLILSAPMCGLSSHARPHAALVVVGQVLATIAPAAPAPFLKDITDLIFRDPSRRPEARANPLRYTGSTRLRTAFTLKAAASTAADDAKVCVAPLLLLHGTSDHVCPPDASRSVFESSSSTDKTLLEYQDAWHALWTEPIDTRRRLLHDLLSWVAARVPGVTQPNDMRPKKTTGSDSEDDEPSLSPSSTKEAMDRGEPGLRLLRPLGTSSFRDISIWSSKHDPHVVCFHQEGGEKEGGYN